MRSVQVTTRLLLLFTLMCRVNASQQHQQKDKAEHDTEKQPVELLLQRLSHGDVSLPELAGRLSQANRQHLMLRLFNQGQRTLQAGVDLCWAIAGVSCVCAHMHVTPDRKGRLVRDFACASVLNASECAAASAAGLGCARCPAEFGDIECTEPVCVSTCQCRCSHAWPSPVRPCSSWCDASAQCPSGGGGRASCRRKADHDGGGSSGGGSGGGGGGGRAGIGGGGDDTEEGPGLSASRVWNGMLVCLFLLACLFVAAYGCRLCALCSRLWAGARRSFANLRGRVGVGLSGSGGGGSGDSEEGGGDDGGGDDDEFGRPRRRRRSHHRRDRVGSFLSLSCAESINVVSPTDLILPSYRELPGGPVSPPTYEQAQQLQQLDSPSSPPPPYSELSDQQSNCSLCLPPPSSL